MSEIMDLILAWEKIRDITDRYEVGEERNRWIKLEEKALRKIEEFLA